MATQHIYVLEITDLPPEVPNIFYVGRTNNPIVRERQHRSAWMTGTEDKYAYIREIEAAGGSWRLRVIKEIPENDYPLDYERWYVIDFTRKGHELMNMKHGDAEKRKELAAQVSNISIRSVSDVRKEREYKDYERSEALKKKIREAEELERKAAEMDALAEERKQLRKLKQKIERKGSINAENDPEYLNLRQDIQDKVFLQSFDSMFANMKQFLENEEIKLEKYLNGELTGVEKLKAQNNPKMFDLDVLIASTQSTIEWQKKRIKELFYRAASMKPEMFNESDYSEIDSL